ncbi:MAG: penicillin-binding protein [bacterium]
MLKKYNKKQIKIIIRNTILVLIIGFILSTGALLIWASTIKTPDLSSFDDRLLGQSAKIYDRTGNVLLYDLSEKVRRTVTPFDQISPYAKKTTIAIEDVDFYNHGGIKISSIIRAFFANLFTLKFSQGGSTITQQVVKNSLLSQDKNIARKVKEWILAIKLEQNTSKDTILNMYLNEAPYGGNIYGIEEASSLYFNKKSKDLTLAESAYLASLPQSPSVLSPYGKNRDKLESRKNLVLKKALDAKMITEDEYKTALAERVVFQPKSIDGIKAPHFVMYVKDYLVEKYGEELLSKSGLKITTTLDYDLQQKTEQLVYNYVTKNGPSFKAGNAAVVATDPKTGQILTMVGSKDYFDTTNDGNFNVATAHRQPGSAFKPFAYATAFMKGYTPDTPLYDVLTEFNVNCSPSGLQNSVPGSENSKCYSPQNYEGGYKGLMNFRSALAQSRNIPSVKVLYLAGIDDTIKTATAMGINELGPASKYGLTLVLGGGEVSPLDMTSAYGVFANNGQKAPLISVLKIENEKGDVLEQAPDKVVVEQVITEQSAKLINDVLSDKQARSSIFAPSTFGDRVVAIKTGTTNNSKDAWEIGYTPSISIGAWMGNNNNTPMAQQASARIVGPLWKSIMDFELTRIPVESFDPPEPTESGLKPYLTGSWMGPGTEVHSELYWIDRKNPKGSAPGLNSNDEQFKNWEYGVTNWSTGQQALGLIQKTPITTPSNGFIGTSTNQSTESVLQITSPAKFATINKQSKQTIVVSGLKTNTISVEYYINGVSIGKSTESPFFFSYIPQETKSSDFEDELKAVETDSNGNQREMTTVYSVK